MRALTHASRVRAARRRRRRAVQAAGALTACTALMIAGGGATVDVALAEPPATAEPAMAEGDLEPLRPQLPLLVDVDDAHDDDGFRAAQRATSRTQIAPTVVRAASVAAPKPAGPRMLRACGYRWSIQQHPVLDATQQRNARTIIRLATMLGLPPRAAVIGVATAFQESNLRNLNWGDRDSLGLFQQRPSKGWGDKRLVRTPAFAAAAFYVPLVQTPGWKRMSLTRAAQLIQRSAYPTRYAQWEFASAKLVKKQLRVSDAALNCVRR